MKKNVFFIMILLIIIIFVYGFHQVRKPNNNSEKISFLDKCAYKDIDEKWVYYFCVSYSRDDKNKFSKIRSFEFNGVDLLKKDNSQKYLIPVVDNTTGIQIDNINADLHLLLYKENTRNDVEKIMLYFNEKFNKKSIKSDLKNLDLKVVNPDTIIELYNNAIKKEEQEFGKYGNLPAINTIVKETFNGEFVVGYIINYGNIEYLKIDFFDKTAGKYLSDIVKNEYATSEQISLNNDIVKLESEIVKNQSFDVKNIVKSKYTDINELKKIFKEIIE